MHKNIILVIVDNGSENDSYKHIKSEFNLYKNVIIIKSDINLGYVKGNNLGIKELRKRKCEHIFIINPDIVLLSDRILNQMLKGCCSQVGIVMPTINNLDVMAHQKVICKKKISIFPSF